MERYFQQQGEVAVPLVPKSVAALAGEMIAVAANKNCAETIAEGETDMRLLGICFITLFFFSVPALPIDYLWSESAGVSPSLDQGTVPSFSNGTWMSYRQVNGGITAMFRSAGQSDVLIDCIYPSATKVVVLTHALNANRLGVFTVRIFSESNRHSGGLIFVDGNKRTSSLIVTEPYLLQRGIIDEEGQIWALATIRDSNGKHLEVDHPALIKVNPTTGERVTVMNKQLIPHTNNGAHGTWGAARTHVSKGQFTAYLPTENTLILLNESGEMQKIQGPSNLGEDPAAISVMRCGQNVFLSAQGEDKNAMFQFNLQSMKWDAVAWKSHRLFVSAAPRLISCQAGNSIEVALGGKTVGTLIPMP